MWNERENLELEWNRRERRERNVKENKKIPARFNETVVRLTLLC